MDITSFKNNSNAITAWENTLNTMSIQWSLKRGFLYLLIFNKINKSYTPKPLLLVSSSVFQNIYCIKAIYVYSTILPCSIVIYGTDVYTLMTTLFLIAQRSKLDSSLSCVKMEENHRWEKNLLIFGRTLQYQQVQCFQ